MFEVQLRVKDYSVAYLTISITVIFTYIVKEFDFRFATVNHSYLYS